MAVSYFLIAVVLAIVGGLGLAMAAVAVRGRRLNDHPICRRCRFDLVGIFPGGAACPECGASLSPRRAVRLGERRMRPAMLAAAATVLVLDLGVGGVTIWAYRSGFDLNTIKPAWLLTREAGSRRDAIAGSALGELAARLSRGELDRDHALVALGHALDHQGDRSKPLLTEAADYIKAAAGANLLTPEDLVRYAQQALEFRMVPRARVAAESDRSLIAIIKVAGARAAPAQFLRYNAELIDATLGGAPLKASHAQYIGSVSPYGEIRWYIRGQAAAEPGPGTLSTRWRLTLFPPGDQDNVIGSWEFTLEGETTVLSPGEAVVPLVLEDPEGAPMEQRLSIERLEVSGSGKPEALIGQAVVNDLPVDVVASVTLRDGEREWKLPASLELAAPGSPLGEIAGSTIWWGLPEGFDAKRVDIVLTPNPANAAGNTLSGAIWGRQIILRDVPVDWTMYNMMAQQGGSGQ